MPLNNVHTELDADQTRMLLALAREAIAYGLAHGKPPSLTLSDWSPPLRTPCATFVTLEKQGHLRGCIGTLEARRPLVEDIAYHAFAAAFHDPRFAPLTAEEWPEIDVRVSILSPPARIEADTEEALIRQLRPGVDGLILEEGTRRSTFLPSVWEELPHPADFVRFLKRKAGWSPDYWSPGLQAYRYTAQYLSDSSTHLPS